jgi:hypothetical protein
MKNFRNLVREGRSEEGFSSVAAATLKHKQNKESMPKLKEENDTTEKTEMAETQLHFIHYAAEEILDYIDDGGEVEEWYQNKLSKVHSDMESLHSYIEGESRRTGMKEEVEQIDELSKKTLGGYIKSATHDVAAKGAATRQFAIDASRKSGEQDYDGARKSMQKSDKTFSKSWKRRDNMAKAVDRLTKENVELLDEKNKPTNPELWSRAIAQAKSKFDVYPSAYANGWAAKWYKERGGGWRSVNEAEERGTEPFLKTSRKTDIVKNIAKKKSKPEKFESDPILSSTVTRNH